LFLYKTFRTGNIWETFELIKALTCKSHLTKNDYARLWNQPTFVSDTNNLSIKRNQNNDEDNFYTLIMTTPKIATKGARAIAHHFQSVNKMFKKFHKAQNTLGNFQLCPEEFIRSQNIPHLRNDRIKSFCKRFQMY